LKLSISITICLRNLIAQEPPPARDAARMLVLYRAEQRWKIAISATCRASCARGIVLVLNDSRSVAIETARQGGQGCVD